MPSLLLLHLRRTELPAWLCFASGERAVVCFVLRKVSYPYTGKEEGSGSWFLELQTQFQILDVKFPILYVLWLPELITALVIKRLCFKHWKHLSYSQQRKWVCIFSFRNVWMIWKSLCDTIKTFNLKTRLRKSWPDLWLKGDWGKALVFLILWEIVIVQPSNCHRRIIGM